MKISIIGAGAYGLALASRFHSNNNEIKMWTKSKTTCEMINNERINKKVLPDYKVPEDIFISNDLSEVIKNAELIVISIPAGYVSELMIELTNLVKPSQHIIVASKGIEQHTCHFVHDIVLNNIDTKKFGVISGPSFAVDMVKDNPIGLSLATHNKSTERLVKKALENNSLKLRATKDILGVEICGAIKNVIAIAAGMLKGMGYPESTQAMFVTEALNDIKELIKALGGNKKTILSFAGFGDLLLTATSEKSRNFKFGYIVGEGKTKKEIDEYINNTTIEGLYTLKSIHKLIRKKKVKMPIINLVSDIVYKNKNPKELAKFLIIKE